MAQSRLIPALVMVAVLALASLAAGPAAASKVTTVLATVTITSGAGNEFRGKVTSAKKQCRAGRTVKLFMHAAEPLRAGSSRSADDEVGTARTNASGTWTMDGAFIAAVYYAQVIPVVLHINGVPVRCGYDVSVRTHF